MDRIVVAELVILLLVLVLPLVSRGVERNLEGFFLVMGLASALAAGVVSASLISDALAHPIPLTLAVLASGLLFKWTRRSLRRGLVKLRSVMPMPVLLATVCTALALLSSVITAIIAALVLVELIGALRLQKDDESRVVVIACMAIGLGAALTPLGEPLSTIAVAKLRADFWFLLQLLGPWIIPGIVVLAIGVGVQALRGGATTLREDGDQETYRDVVVRASRIYLFVMALTLLGEGFTPLVNRFVIQLDARVLYWGNTVSAILDNATLTAAEVSAQMTRVQVRAVLLGLLISGGILIPGNIPNIIAAQRLGIRSRTWARWGAPLGLILLCGYFLSLFVL